MTEDSTSLDAYDFDLPRELIAARPARPRDSARLLSVGGGLGDRRICDLLDLLAPGDLLVVNDTRVMPARLTGHRGEARVEVTLIRATDDGWLALARPARRLRPGDRIVFSGRLSAEMVAKGEGGAVTLRFDRAGAELMTALEAHGAMPLPPYIPRVAGPDEQDRDDYQTMFAARAGAIAAPTAGLHFTPRLADALEARGIGRASVTLHVGPGTFLPVKAADLRDHQMHAEWGEIPVAAADAVNAARAAGGRIVAIGSTSLRLLESAADDNGTVRPFRGETDLFIMPGYRFKAVDMLLTNFHLPRSTLFVLVAAFAGRKRMLAAYAHAKRVGYRFYSYGDACLLERGERA